MYYSKSLLEIFELLNSSEAGLSQEEAQRRLKEAGFNVLAEPKPENLFKIFLRQFQSALIYVLLIAAFIVFILGETIDGFIILAILIFNAIVGTIQEGRAQNTLASLKKFIRTNAIVRRDDKEIIISDSHLVSGDIIILKEGEKVPADARMIFSNNLKVDQSTLTGESEPVYKISEVVHHKDLPVIEQQNMVFKGTHIVSGAGEAIVVAIGLNTVVGRISQKIALIDTEIPLRKDVRRLSRLIIISVSAISAILFFSGLYFDKSVREMFTTVVALSVSIIPEGLPVVLTLVLAQGVWRMAKRNALVKRLQAVEALGQAKIIAVDKTGTITKNELAIQKVFTKNKMFEITGIGYESKGEVYLIEDAKEKKLISPPDFEELILAGKIAGFCANAGVFYSEETKTFTISGDPTEAALLVFAQKLGFQKEIIESQHPLIQETPFDYKRRYHLTLRKLDGKKILAIVGAPEAVLAQCRLSKIKIEELNGIFHQMSKGGLRVLAFAFSIGFSVRESKKLTFGGFYGMKDSLRPEVKEAIKQAQQADLKVIMITGDHKLTAQAIAEESGIYKEGDEILTDEEMEKLSDEELSQKLAKTTVFARITPEHKLRIIEVYRKRGEIVAMTGDGVNDAPSLVAADLGVAMGKIGTEVAKEAADIVLLDDNFSSIVSAIEEGRNIYKTIKKVILYLFSTSLGEVLTISVALFLNYPLPLLASQIIWLNFVTDGFLTVALAMEPKEDGLLKDGKKSNSSLVDSLMIQRMFIMALPMALGSFFIFQKYLSLDFSKALAMSLTTLAVFQWLNAYNCRSENKSIFQMNFFSNKWLIGATFVVILLQLLAVYHPLMQKILRTTALGLTDWLIAIAVSFLIIIAEELRKFIVRYKNAP